MEAPSSSSSRFNDEERALKTLLDMFGSAFSFDQLASAYCQAGRDPDMAAEVLFEMQARSFSSSSSSSTTKPYSESLCEGNDTENENSRPTTAKKSLPASIGSVSSVIGKGYAQTYRPKNGSCVATKPVKLDSSVLPESEIWGEDVNSDPSLKRKDSVHQHMEVFLCGILGSGFKLGRDVIREVLDACGYDMPKSMERLIDMSTEVVDKKMNSVCDSFDKFMKTSSEFEVPSPQKKSMNLSHRNDDKGPNSRVLAERRQKHVLERTVLTSLFSAERKEDLEPPKRRLDNLRAGMFGKTVSEALINSFIEPKKNAVEIQKQTHYDKEEEERYQAIRKAWKDYRALMKEYYQAAIDAYSKGDQAKAKKLLEQGQFFQQKARKADEESNEMTLEIRNEEEKDVIILDIHECGAKEAIRLLKCHLSSLSGISSKYLKLIIDTDQEDSSKGSRKRLVLKLLEKESIKWEEEENVGTILIQLDRINRRKLSFVKE